MTSELWRQIHFCIQPMLRGPAALIFSEGAGRKPSRSVPSKCEGGEAPKRAGAERRTRWPASRSGRSADRRRPPANNARRRAFRRFTAAIFGRPGSALFVKHLRFSVSELLAASL